MYKTVLIFLLTLLLVASKMVGDIPDKIFNTRIEDLSNITQSELNSALKQISHNFSRTVTIASRNLINITERLNAHTNQTIAYINSLNFSNDSCIEELTAKYVQSKNYNNRNIMAICFTKFIDDLIKIKRHLRLDDSKKVVINLTRSWNKCEDLACKRKLLEMILAKRKVVSDGFKEKLSTYIEKTKESLKKYQEECLDSVWNLLALQSRAFFVSAKECSLE